MVGTKHCCWGACSSDSRYPEKLPKSLIEMQNAGLKIFIPFAKPSQGIERSQRWLNACSRQNFTMENITRSTYICALHWPGEKGPTAEFPDPLKANLTPKEVENVNRRKRRAPKQRGELLKKTKTIESTQSTSDLNEDVSLINDVDEDSNDSDVEQSNNKSTQTEFEKIELAPKIETTILKNEVNISMPKNIEQKIVSNISYEFIGKDSQLMKHFTGLTSLQFEVLFNFLNDVCPLDELRYWSCHGSKLTKVSNNLPGWSPKEKLFICLVRLRRGFTLKTLSILLTSPGKEIKEASIRAIFTTYIQLMYKVFREMDKVMFPSKEHLQKFLPKVFRTMKNTRCIVDCTEFKVQSSRSFARQGNTSSSSKHSDTVKCLIAVTPNGGACFVSDLFEGDILDVEIIEESGILNHIEPNDIILVDRGFTEQDPVNPLQARIKVAAVLKLGRSSLSVAEELSTGKIANARIPIERFIQRLKQFKLIGRTIPLSIAPLATQMVVVASALVNFQPVLCK